MMTPDDIDVWVGLDVGKSAHHAHALDHDGNTLYDKPLKQDEKAIRTMLGKLSKHGRVLLVVDQPNTIGSLPLTVARNMGIAVAYLPGTAMRRTAQLLPGDAKTDRRDAHVIAWAALKLPETLRDAGPDDETLAALKLLAGHDEDLAHESTRHVNRLRSLLLQTHPAFERALKGERITRDATLALLERYGGPMGVKRAGIEDVKDWAKSNGLRAGRIIDDMFKAIGEQTVTVPGTLMAETIIPSIAHDIKTIRDRRREVGRQVEKLLEDHPLLTVLTSMPGIGVRTASNILLGIGGDIANFKSSAHLAAYAGISPVTGQSGTLMAETIIPSIAHDIKTIRDRRREVGRQVEKLLEDHPLLTVLTSMPGIGVRTASNILLGIGGDIANFKSSAHLAAYAGISPVTGQSGTSIKGERPSRRGNKRLKNALWQTAFVASTKHPPSVAYYKRKREQGKHHNAAIICLARRRCDVIYSMLKNGTLYQEPALVA